MSARILTCSEREYFADPCAVPSLSQSIAHTIVSESPRHAWQTHPRLGGVPQESTKATDEGAILHRLLFGVGAEPEILPYDNFRTKAAQQERDSAIAAGRIPVTLSAYQTLVTAAAKIRDSLQELNISLEGGESELAIEWQERGTRGPVLCRGRLDILKRDARQVLDVKKIRSAHPRTCQRHIIEYGYHIQHAAYTSATAKLLGGDAPVDMIFLFMEIEPPYAVLPVRLTPMLRNLGHSRWSRAVHIWEECLATNTWPAYATGVTEIDAPAWALNEEMEIHHVW